MRKQIRKVLAIVSVVILVFVVIGAVLVGVYVSKGVNGLLTLPGVSALLGLDKTRDLGMGAISDTDRDSLIVKLGGDPVVWAADAGSSTVPTKSSRIELTPKELAALLMSGKGADIFKDLQLSILENGNFAASGIVRLDGVLAFANMNRSDIEGQVGDIPDEVPVYIELVASPTQDGSLGISVRQLKIGNITVPGSALGIDASQLDPIVRDFIQTSYGFGLTRLVTQGDVFVLEIQVPEAG